MNRRTRKIGLKRQLRRFTIPLIIFISYWGAGVVLAYFIEVDKSFWNLLLVSMSIRDGTTSDFLRIYQMLWPILFELLILGFLASILLELYSFNPEAHSLRKAKHQKNHSIILGYNHLGERIVDYLREHKKSYVVVDHDQDRADSLIFAGEPVIEGDYSDETVLRTAGIKKCKEVFCVTTKLRNALVAAGKIRKLNPNCDLYMRVFNEHFRQNLTSKPYNAFTFSTSNWAMNSVKHWSEKLEKKALILGSDSLVKRILSYFGEILKKDIVAIDSAIEPDLYSDFSNVSVIQDDAIYLESIEDCCDMGEISQVYICWNKQELFSDSIILTMELRKNYPTIEVYVRIFDEELAELARDSGASTFSTSAYSFKMLQKEVRRHSNLYLE